MIQSLSMFQLKQQLLQWQRGAALDARGASKMLNMSGKKAHLFGWKEYSSNFIQPSHRLLNSPGGHWAKAVLLLLL